MHGDVDGALAGDLVGAVFRLLLLLLRRRLLGPGGRLGVRGLRPAPAAASAAAVEAVAAGAAARPRALALRRRVGRLHGGRDRLPPAQLGRLGPGRGQLLELGLRGRRRLVVEARHGVGFEGQALPQLLQCLLLLFLQLSLQLNLLFLHSLMLLLQLHIKFSALLGAFSTAENRA